MTATMSSEEFAEALRARGSDLSAKVMARLKALDEALLAGSERHNLVARSTLPDRWRRHFLDSAQLFPFIPEGARRLVDLGSGAGFPGLALAAMGRESGLRVDLVESVGKKAGFLAEAVRSMGLDNVTVHAQRIERLQLGDAPDVITARALAPLVKLLGYVHGIVGQNTLCLLPKGQDVEGELTMATKSWHMDVEQAPSMTSADARILLIRNLSPRQSAPQS